MNFSGDCRFYFWTGWTGWVLATWAIVYGEYTWRVPEPPGGYMVEAGALMLSWFGALALADHLAIAVYRHVWRQLKQGTIAPIVLEQQVIDRIRGELASDPLLRWLRPPQSKDVRGQLMTAALWWQALCAPEGSSRWERYGEWLQDTLLGYLPLLIAVSLVIMFPSWRGWGTAALVGAVGCGVLGHSLIRLAARRQAIVDYFNAWRSGEG